MLNRGLYDLAATEYRGFLEGYANHEKAGVATYGLGVSLFRLQRYDEAADVLAPVSGRRGAPYPAETATIAGQCMIAMGEPAKATSHFEYVLDRHSDHDLADEAASLLAEAFYYSGQYERVEQPYRLVRDNWPESPLRERTELFANLSRMARGKYNEAVEGLGKMIDRFPGGECHHQAELLLAQSLHRSNAIERALAQYRRVLQAAQEQYVPEAMYGLALLQQQQGEAKQAATVIETMVDRYPDHDIISDAKLLQGRVQFDLGQYADARRLLEELASREDDNEISAIYWAAKSLLREGKTDEAAKRLRVAIRRFPKSELAAEMLFDFAVALLRSDQMEASLEALDQFEARYSKHKLAADALHLSAVAEHRLEHYDASAERCLRFQREYPRHTLAPAVAFLIGENAFLSQDYEGAARAFSSYLDRHANTPQQSKAEYRLGMSQYQSGRFDEAQAALEGVADGQKTEAAFRTALLALGDIHFQEGRWPAAETNLNDYLSFGVDQWAADDALLKLGLARHRQERPAEALEAYDALLGGFSDSEHELQAVFERGQVLSAMKRSDEAKAAFERVVDAGNDTAFAAHALNHLGAIALSNKEFAEASGYFSRAAALGPDDAFTSDALFHKGQALMAEGRFEDAGAAFAELVEGYADSQYRQEARARMAIAFARAERHDAALAVIAELDGRELSDLDDALTAAVWYEKAWCLRSLERTDQAEGAYRALIAGPQAGDLRDRGMLELAELRAAAGDHEEAGALLTEMLKGRSDDEEGPESLRGQGMYRLGRCEYEMEHFARAGDVLEQYLGDYPSSDNLAPAGLLCGESLLRAGAHERAASHLRQVVRQHKENDAYGPALLRLGECLAALQHWARSEDAFAEYLLHLSDTDSWYQAQFGVGWACENQDRREDAIKAYRKVVERHQGPTAARAQFQIGECFYAAREFEEAVRELMKVDILYGYPEWSAAALYEAGRCFEELGKTAEARKQFEQVRTMHAETEWADLAGERLTRLAQTGLPGR